MIYEELATGEEKGLKNTFFPIPPNQNMTKTILIALDGATWDVLDPLLQKGEMPVIQSLIAHGCRGSLGSLSGYKSPALWTSIATGKFPEETGITYFSNLFLELPLVKKRINISNNIFIKGPYMIGKLFSSNLKKPGKITTLTKQSHIYAQEKLGNLLQKCKLGGNYLVTSTFRTQKAFWEIWNDAGKSCGIVGWLATWPTDKIKGFMISPKACPAFIRTLASEKRKDSESADPATYPDYLMEALQELNGFELSSLEELKLIFDVKKLTEQEQKELYGHDYNPANLLQFSRHLIHTDQFFLKAAEIARDKYKPDLLAVYLPGIDGFQHIFWRHHQPEQFPFAPLTKNEQKYSSVIVNYYKFIDQKLGKLLKKEKDALIIIMSDHGIKAIPEKDYNPQSIRSGQHDQSPDGIIILNGPMIQKNKIISGAHLLDIMPTLLYLSGLPVDETMTGNVLNDAISDDFLAKTPLHKTTYQKRKVSRSFYSPQEEQNEKEVLKKLGYLKHEGKEKP